MPGTLVCMRSSVSTPSRQVMPESSRKPMAGRTPVALMTRSASSTLPPDRCTFIASPSPRSMRSTLWPVNTCTPCCSHQSRIMPPATGPIMRGTMRSPISTTDSCTPRFCSASMMMQPMKPAPICSTRAPGRARSAMARASASVQQVSTPGRSNPGMGGRTGCEPVAISKRSNVRVWPSSSVTVRAAMSTCRACASTRSMRRRLKCSGCLRR